MPEWALWQVVRVQLLFLKRLQTNKLCLGFEDLELLQSLMLYFGGPMIFSSVDISKYFTGISASAPRTEVLAPFEVEFLPMFWEGSNAFSIWKVLIKCSLLSMGNASFDVMPAISFVVWSKSPRNSSSYGLLTSGESAESKSTLSALSCPLSPFATCCANLLHWDQESFHEQRILDMTLTYSLFYRQTSTKMCSTSRW